VRIRYSSYRSFKKWNEASQMERKALLVVTTIAMMALVLLMAAGCAGGKVSGNGDNLSGKLSNKMVIGLEKGFWTMNPDGSNLTHLSSARFPSLEPTLSPDGTKIAFWGITFECAEGFSPSASATGASAGRATPEEPACTFVMNADGSGMRPLANGPSYHESQPTWSPGGEKIAYEIFAADASDRPHKPVVPYTR
jgi:hypothetical protein